MRNKLYALIATILILMAGIIPPVSAQEQSAIADKKLELGWQKGNPAATITQKGESSPYIVFKAVEVNGRKITKVSIWVRLNSGSASGSTTDAAECKTAETIRDLLERYEAEYAQKKKVTYDTGAQGKIVEFLVNLAKQIEDSQPQPRR